LLKFALPCDENFFRADEISYILEGVVFLDERKIDMEKNVDHKAEKLISMLMLDMGVPAHLKGYRYVRTAVYMAKEDMRVVGSVTKLLYPEIAKQYNTTDGKVERAIRNAIEISWERGNPETFESLFGYCARSGQCRPTNSEYIAAMADVVRLKMHENIDQRGD